MRNIHLGLGLAFVFMALVFALSSMVIIYRPWFNTAAAQTKRETRVQLSAEGAANPRAAALELMARHGVQGELRQIQEKGGSVSFRIIRPGEAAEVEYAVSSGEAKLKTTRHGAMETLVQLHTNHGLWHEYAPSNLWAAISLLASIGLLLLGVSGIYLWFTHYNERVIGGILLALGLIYGLTALVLTRLEQ